MSIEFVQLLTIDCYKLDCYHTFPSINKKQFTLLLVHVQIPDDQQPPECID